MVPAYSLQSIQSAQHLARPPILGAITASRASTLQTRWLFEVLIFPTSISSRPSLDLPPYLSSASSCHLILPHSFLTTDRLPRFFEPAWSETSIFFQSTSAGCPLPARCSFASHLYLDRQVGRIATSLPQRALQEHEARCSGREQSSRGSFTIPFPILQRSIRWSCPSILDHQPAVQPRGAS